MAWQIGKVFLAAAIISLTSSLAGKQPRLAGFLLALPISSMLALAFFYVEYREPAQAVAFAKSVFWAVPLSLLFFVPFLLAGQLKWGFWALYVAGSLCLASGYFLHKLLTP